MRAAHDGLHITENDWSIFLGHLVAVLDKFGIQGREREELLGATTSLKGDVVQGHSTPRVHVESFQKPCRTSAHATCSSRCADCIPALLRRFQLRIGEPI